MRYLIDLDIDLPRTEVVALFDDPDNLHRWQPELISFEPISGQPGQPGAKSRLRYKMGTRDLELIETITRRELPDVFAGTYEAPGTWNEVTNRFRELGPHRTRWTVETKFRFAGLFMTLMGYCMPGVFKRQTRAFMVQFKAFAEADRGEPAVDG